MSSIAVTISLLLLAAAVMARRTGLTWQNILPADKPEKPEEPFARGSVDAVVNFEPEDAEDHDQDLVISIKGTIRGRENDFIVAHIVIEDITDSQQNPEPVYENPPAASQDPTFRRAVRVGKITGGTATLSDFSKIASIPTDQLLLPRSGRRMLKVDICFRSQSNQTLLGLATVGLPYENPHPGYIDLEQARQRVGNMAVALALTISAADGEITEEKSWLIKNWIRDNLTDPTDIAQHDDFDKAFDKALKFFKKGCRIDIDGMAAEIAENGSPAQKYDIIELCMKVAAADGKATRTELMLLKKLSNSFRIDTERFRSMLEKFLPVGMHDVHDAELVLGINENMDPEQSRRQLNAEYRKWNSRVTSSDPSVQNQADHMLKLIAQARAANLNHAHK
jgi:uncharacterized tellurite resistance protein B-like protein